MFRAHVLIIVIGKRTNRWADGLPKLRFPDHKTVESYEILTPYNNLSHYLTNLMHKICFTISFISCLYMPLETYRAMK